MRYRTSLVEAPISKEKLKALQAALDTIHQDDEKKRKEREANHGLQVGDTVVWNHAPNSHDSYVTRMTPEHPAVVTKVYPGKSTVEVKYSVWVWTVNGAHLKKI